MPSQIEVFVNEESGVQSVVLVLRDVSIVEYDGELVPAAGLTHGQARQLAEALIQKADEIYSR